MSKGRVHKNKSPRTEGEVVTQPSTLSTVTCVSVRVGYYHVAKLSGLHCCPTPRVSLFYHLHLLKSFP